MSEYLHFDVPLASSRMTLLIPKGVRGDDVEELLQWLNLAQRAVIHCAKQNDAAAERRANRAVHALSDPTHSAEEGR